MKPNESYEPTDAATGLVAIVAWSFALFIVITSVVLWVGFGSSFEKWRARQTQIAQITFPAPRLRSDTEPWTAADEDESRALNEALNTAAEKKLIHLHFSRSEP